MQLIVAMTLAIILFFQAQNIDESVDYDSDSVILADDDDTISVRVRYGLSVSKISIKKVC